jgi:hypothetical protein
MTIIKSISLLDEVGSGSSRARHNYRRVATSKKRAGLLTTSSPHESASL